MACVDRRWIRWLAVLSCSLLLALEQHGAAQQQPGNPAAAPAPAAAPVTATSPAPAPTPAPPETSMPPVNSPAPDQPAPDGTSTSVELVGTKQGGGEFKLEQDISKLTIPQMLAQNDKAQAEMSNALKVSLAVLTQARGRKDIVLVNCVNERVTQIKGILRVAQEAGTRLQENAATSNTEGARVDFTQVVMARERIVALRVQAQNCVGSESFYGGETEVVTDINPEMAGGDPFFGDRGVLDNPRTEFSEGNKTNTDNSNPEAPNPPPLTSEFQP